LCWASLSWVQRDHLEKIDVAFRCAPGKRPVVFELTCRGCAAWLVVTIGVQGASFATKERAQQIRSAARSRTRELLEQEFLEDEVD
jgi:hypothetical protein